jgi:hypothetical protein
LVLLPACKHPFQTIGKFTDFDKLGFTVTTTEGKKASVYADRYRLSLAPFLRLRIRTRCAFLSRPSVSNYCLLSFFSCGGSIAEAVVTNEAGTEVARVVSPDARLEAVFARKTKAHPTYMPYFILQVL